MYVKNYVILHLAIAYVIKAIELASDKDCIIIVTCPSYNQVPMFKMRLQPAYQKTMFWKRDVFLL